MKKNSLDKIALRIIELLTANGADNFSVDYYNIGFVFYPTNNHINPSAKEIENQINTLLTEFINQRNEEK